MHIFIERNEILMQGVHKKKWKDLIFPLHFATLFQKGVFETCIPN